MEIRTAGQEDIVLIRKLVLEIWPITFGEILSAEQIKYMLEMMYSEAALHEQMENGHVFLIPYLGNEPVGYSSYQLGYQGRDLVKIHKIYLLPQTQGKGFGKRMIAEIEQIAKREGFSTLGLNVNRFNKAYSFYERIGFLKVGEEDIDIGNGFLMEDAIMEKRIN